MPPQTAHGTKAVEALHHEDNSKGTTDGALTEEYDPWDPPHPPPHPSLDNLTCHVQHMRECFLADARTTNIIAHIFTTHGVILIQLI